MTLSRRRIGSTQAFGDDVQDFRVCVRDSHITRKSFLKLYILTIISVFTMIIVTFKAHSFDKYMEEWYSIIVILCRNPSYIYAN